MKHIKLFNQISPIIKKSLDASHYQLSEDINEYEGVLVRSAKLHDIEFPPQLLAIARAGVGVNNIPIDKCSEAGIVVFNTPGANANAVRELVLCSLLLSGRDIIGGIQWANTLTQNVEETVEKGKSNFIGPELKGKTLGVIGLGAVGIQVANSASQGLGMKVIGFDPFISVDAAWKLSSSVMQAKNINEILDHCDYITLHTPLTPETKEMLNHQSLSRLKEGAVILNFSRADLVNDDAILEALASQKVRQYVTDFPNQKLMGQKGVVLVPHLGASTPESEENCASMAAHQLKVYLEDGNIINSVNFPACEMPRSGKARLCIINKNIASMVSQMTTVLGEEKINIETMLNKSRGSWAYNLIDLSSKPHKEAIDKLKAIDGIVSVRLI
ncbi:MAG: phosphoglycerate dehydrogenase [Brevinema sp.]